MQAPAPGRSRARTSTDPPAPPPVSIGVPEAPQFSSHLPEFPTGLPNNYFITRIATLENGDASQQGGDSIDPAMHARLKSWIERDINYQKQLVAERTRSSRALVGLGRELVMRPDWRGTPTQPQARLFRAVMPDERFHSSSQRKRGKPRKPLRLSKRSAQRVADQDEVLCPIRLDLDYEGYKLRDTFTWNIKDTVTDVEAFASLLCDDMLLPANPFVSLIASSINEQLEESRKFDFEEFVLTPQAIAESSQQGSRRKNPESDAWWKGWRRHLRPELERVEDSRGPLSNGNSDDHNARRKKRIKLETTPQIIPLDDDSYPFGDHDGYQSATEHVLPNSSKPEGPDFFSSELRILIKLDITLNNLNLSDQLEWDLGEPRNCPEEFASSYAAELGLSGEFTTAVAHSIREQIDTYVKSLGIIEHRPGQPVTHDELRAAFQPILYDVVRFREVESEFTPKLDALSAEELERVDRERERDVRRKRRQGRPTGGGRRTNNTASLVALASTLPDRDPIKTHRTLVPKSGSSMPAPGTDDNENVIAPEHEISLPYEIVWPRTSDPNHNTPDTSSSETRPSTSRPIPGNANLPPNKNLNGLDPLAFASQQLEAPTRKTAKEKHASPPANLPRSAILARSHKRGMAAAAREAKKLEDEESARLEEERRRRESGEDLLTEEESQKQVPKVEQSDNTSQNIGQSNSSSTFLAPPPVVKGEEEPPAVNLEQALNTGNSNDTPPLWLGRAVQNLMKSRPNDQIEITKRPKQTDAGGTVEWRLRCLDCPGKLYTPGPGETLDNFMVHIRNRVHLANIDRRLGGDGGNTL